MDILLNEEKEKYFLKLVQEGAKLPHHFNVKTIVMPEEETKASKAIENHARPVSSNDEGQG